ncbi:MAG: MBL fold metallo-hydrolase [Dehalococcoidales bacterium]|nr:MAG: MBL fold metallo-hydrolase [Dehalococcoidales bacterium]
MSMKFRWLGYVCFEMVLPSGKVLVIDPYIDYSPTAPVRCQEVTGADYIALTHGHFDHVTDVGTLVKKFGSRVICSHDVAEPLTKLFNLEVGCINKVTAGDIVVFDDLRVEVKKGQHVDLRRVMETLYERVAGQQPDPDMPLAELMQIASPDLVQESNLELNDMRERIRAVGLDGGEQLTFVFQATDNLRICIYSSDAFEFLRQEVIDAHASVIFSQVGAVSPRKAAEFAALSGADVVVPTHHDGNGEEMMHRTAQAMARYLAANSSAYCLDIVPGQWYEMGVKVSPIRDTSSVA